MDKEGGNSKGVFGRLGKNQNNSNCNRNHNHNHNHNQWRLNRAKNRPCQYTLSSSNNGSDFPNINYTWSVPLVMGFTPEKNNKLCKFWAQSNCNYGDRCKFLHPLDFKQDVSRIALPSGEHDKVDTGVKDGDVQIWDCLTGQESKPLCEKTRPLLELSDEGRSCQPCVKVEEENKEKEGKEEEREEDDGEKKGEEDEGAKDSEQKEDKGAKEVEEKEGKGELASESTHSNSTNDPLLRFSEQEMLERFRRKRQSVTMAPLIPASPSAKKPRTGETKATPSASNDVVIQLPSQFLEWGGQAGAIWPSAEQLAFPAPQQRLASMSSDAVLGDGIFLLLHSLQHFLASRSQNNIQESVVKELTTKLEQEVKTRLTAQEQLAIKAGELIENQRQVDFLSDEVTGLKGEVADLKGQVTKLTEDLKDAATFYTWLSRARLMKQYMEDRTSTWTPKEDVDQFLSYIGKPEDLLTETNPAKDAGQATDIEIDTLESIVVKEGAETELPL